MESSSEDGSFVWTDASNSISSDDMVTDRGGGNSGGEESEYDKNYKKKLHKELFTNENGCEKEVRIKKRKRERHTSGSEHSDTSRKKIKVEPESDMDAGRARDTHAAVNGYDEHLLDEKVKKEQEFLLPSDKVKKKKRKKSTCNDNVDIHVKLDTESNRAEEKPAVHSDTGGASSRVSCEGSDRQDEYNVTKKKKKKKKSEKREESPHVMEIDDIHNESAVRQQTSTSSESRRKETGQKEKHSHDDVSGDLTVDSTTADLDISQISKISNVNVSQDESLAVRHDEAERRLSERIQFEDDVVDSEPRGAVRATRPGPSDKLKLFAEKHSRLRACAVREPAEFTIGDRDEVWLVTCPGDVDLAAFAGRSLELGGRCKVKLQGAAYEGAAAPGAGGGALLAGARLRRVPLAGRLALHRRAPRAPPAPAPAPPRAARVPLPDTKLRHPLLGAHYKKALKLPPAVRERLHAAPPPAPAPRRRRKSEAPPTPAPSKKKAKRKKHDLEAPETWESERAIEESLFDF